MSERDHLSKYQGMFQRWMAEVDPLQQAILKGHLIIEAALDNILSIIFFHPEHVFKGRFSFVHKVRIARAYGLRKDANTIWNLVQSINEVRNEVAHSLAGEKRDIKLKQLRRIFIAETSKELRASLEAGGTKLEDLPDETVVVYACSLCTGFLGTYEADVSVLRRMIDGLDVVLNPDQERILRATPEEARKKKG